MCLTQTIDDEPDISKPSSSGSSDTLMIVSLPTPPYRTGVRQNLCGNQILRRVRAESSRRPPRHRREACSMAWRCRFLTARPSQRGHVIAEK